MAAAGPHEITEMLARAAHRDERASEALLPLLYEVLRAIDSDPSLDDLERHAVRCVALRRDG